MTIYAEHNIKIGKVISDYHEIVEKNKEGKPVVYKRCLKIEMMARVIKEETKNRQGQIKDLKVPIPSKQSLIEKLKACGIVEGLSDSSLMPDIRVLGSYTGVVYVMADSGAKRGSRVHIGKYS